MDRVVLVVDDDADNREPYVLFLAGAGFRVLTAGTGPEALEIARAERPDVVVLDLTLPGMDGWELARRLRAEPATRAACLVALTGHTTGEAWQRALDAGVNGYLLKPCPPEEVVAEIEKLRPGA